MYNLKTEEHARIKLTFLYTIYNADLNIKPHRKHSKILILTLIYCANLM